MMANSAICSHMRAPRSCTPLSKPSFASGRQPSNVRVKCGSSQRLRYPASTDGLRWDARTRLHVSQQQTARQGRQLVCNASSGGNSANPTSHPSATWPMPEAGTKEQGGILSKWRSWWYIPQEAEESAGPKVSTRKTLRRLIELISGDRGYIFLATLFGALAASVELAIPHYTSAAIFSVTKGGSSASFQRNVQLLMVFAVSYAALAGLRGVLFSILNLRLMQRLRSRVFNRLIEQPVAFFDEEEVGALTSRLGADCQSVARALSSNFNVAFRNGLQCVGGAAYLIYLSRSLAITCGAILALLALVALRYGAFQRSSQRAYQNELANTNQVAEEAFTLSRVVRTFGSERQEGERYASYLARLAHISARQAAAYFMYLSTACVLYYITKVATLLLGGYMALNGVINAEQLTSYVLYVEFVTSASLSVCDQWGPFMEALGASERVISYLDRPPAPQIAPGRILPHWNGSVAFQGVEFRYAKRPEVMALNQVNLTLEPGKVLALVGLSGSGKSTLVSLLQRLYDPTAGQVSIEGVDLREIDAAWFRRQIGVVSQDPHLFSDTIAHNIAYGLDDVTPDDVEAAARMANAHDFIHNLPLGYQTVVNDKLLSGGERQRIALARALVRQPALLILDEATSALDAESEAAVQEALDRIMKTSRCTVLVIAHRLVTVRNADTIVVMNQGQLAEQGSHEELMAEGGIYASLVERQNSGVECRSFDMAPTTPESEKAVVGKSRDELAGLSSERRAEVEGASASLDDAPSTSEASDEMWAAGGDVAVHDVPVSASHKNV